LTLVRIETVRRFVKDHQDGIVQKRGGEAHTAPIAFGENADRTLDGVA